MRFTTGALASLLTLTACGYTSPGGGTKTLYVTARLSSDGTTKGSKARVTVREGGKDGAVVKNAEVVIRGGALGKTTVPFDDGRDLYQLDGFTWVDGIRLEVIRGSDLLDGAIDTPGPTLITEPISDSAFRRSSGTPFIVHWKDERGSVASNTQVRLEEADLDRSIPVGFYELRVEASQLSAGKETVHVERSNEVTLAGGASGSVMSATTEHAIEFTVE